MVFVSLAALHDPELLASTILQALRRREDGSDFSTARLHQLVGIRSLLLLLDNFEHVTPAADVIAARHVNRAVGEMLCISPATVARHIANIYRKLAVDSRAEVTAYGLQHGLV